MRIDADEMLLYGNYEPDKAAKLQLMREINLQGAVSRLRFAAEKRHGNKGDGKLHETVCEIL